MINDVPSICEEPGQKVVLIYKSRYVNFNLRYSNRNTQYAIRESRYAEVMLSGSILISGSWDTFQNVSR